MYLNRTSGQLNPRGGGPQSNLITTTVRQFDGGLNVMDADLNMSPKFARALDNLERATDGSLSLRPGTRLYCNTLNDSTPVVNHTYFAGHVIAVQNSGAWNAVDGAGNGVRMDLVGQPAGTNPWSSGTTYATFTVFNNDLIACNGKDKPILIKGSPSDPNYMKAQYLIDEASGSNVNTPIGLYCVTHGEYLIIAGVSTDPTKLFISAKDTSGTFYGDPAPNDAIVLDIGPRVSLGSANITGMVAYRDKLLITFARGVLPMNLGIYSSTTPAVHTPTDDGFIEEYGCLCHRSLVSVGDDTYFADNIGINNVNRINIFYTLRPLRASHLVDPLTTAAIQPLTPAQIQSSMFAVYDLRNFRYMLFVPTYSGSTVTETVVFSYTNMPTMKIQAWARLRGWNFQSACRTELQNIIFSSGNKLYSYDFETPTQSLDYYGDPAVNGGQGVPITFDWEMPWTDLKHRMNQKQMKYIAFDTIGTGTFQVRAYIDHVYQYANVDAPLLTMNFTAGDVGLLVPPTVPGGPTPSATLLTADERLYAFPAKFHILKLRFSGTTVLPVRFISITIGYVSGSIRR